MTDAFKPTKAVKSTNKKLANHNEEVLKSIRTIDAAPIWMKDAAGRPTYPAPYVDSSLQTQADRYQIKQKLAEKAGNVGEGAWYTDVPLTDEDINFVVKQTELEELVRYDEEFLKMLDLRSPSELERFEKIYPEFFAKRKQYIDQIVDMQVALAKIALLGIVDKSQMDLIINIQALPDGGKKLMDLLSCPVHYLVLANSADFLHAGEKYEHKPEIGAPTPFGVRQVGYKTDGNNLKKVGAGWFPDVARSATGSRVTAYGKDADKTARGQMYKGEDFFSTFLGNTNLK